MVYRLWSVMMRDVFKWLEETADPQLYDSTTFIYEDMASQSGESLPQIYQPFDANRKAHWRDRGAALDYLLSTGARGEPSTPTTSATCGAMMSEGQPSPGPKSSTRPPRAPVESK
jgi:hypothetical protein